jgi:protein TonB
VKIMKVLKSVLMAAVVSSGFIAAPLAAAQDRAVVQTAAPEYPRGAERRNLEGHVVVRYNVTPDGEVADAEVVEATPSGVFERSVLRALEGWRYAATGEVTSGVEQRFDFSFDG